MKKILLSCLIAFSSGLLFAQIPNSDMELWDNQPVLLQWETNSRPLTMPAYDPYVVRKDTDEYTGTYAANFFANGVFKPWAHTTFAITQHPASLSFYYKYLFAPCVNDNGLPQKDTVSVLVEILKDTTVVDSGYWQLSVSGFAQNYLHGVVPITQTSGTFDSCRITIMGGRLFAGCGIIAAATEFKVDHLELDVAGCTDTGVVVQGITCLLIDTGTGNLLMPCNISLSPLGFQVGDTIRFSFSPNACISFCQQGTGVDITCLDTTKPQPPCHLSPSLQKQNPTSYVATNGWLKAVVTNGTPHYFFVWSNNVNGLGVDTITQLGEGHYCVTVSYANNNCAGSACDSLAGPHVCIDSAIMCPQPQGLCCDVPLVDHVCGCDSITYINGCTATYWGGVTSYYHGDCVTSGIPKVSDTQHGIFVWPVPASDKLTIVYDLNHSGSSEMRLINALGTVVQLFKRGVEVTGRYKTEIDLGNLATGIYFVEIKTETERKIKMFVKE